MSPAASWDIRSTNKSDSSLTIDWSGYPVDLVATLFIISLNETPRSSHQNKPIKLLRMAANSSRNDMVLSGLPAFTRFEATVYLMDINNVIYKSNTTSVATEGSGKPTSACFFLFITCFITSLSTSAVICQFCWPYSNVRPATLVPFPFPRS